jgi:hypothetical protein
VWAGLFGYLLLDDAFALHEAFGRSAASLVSLPTVGSVRPEHMGELLFYVAMGLVFAGVLAAALRNGDTAGRSLSVALALPFAVLVFFGVVVDVLHSLVRDRSYRYAAGIIEDGGEMLAMSALVTIVYWVTRGE